MPPLIQIQKRSPEFSGAAADRLQQLASARAAATAAARCEFCGSAIDDTHAYVYMGRTVTPTR